LGGLSISKEGKIKSNNFYKLLRVSKFMKLKIFIFILILFALSSSSYAWIDGWDYRIPINVASLESIEDYQLEITKNLSKEYKEGKINKDCSDVRFTDFRDNLLDFWTEECNVIGESKFWVKMPSIDRVRKGRIYFYYGNDTAKSVSNRVRTFILYDGYSGDELCPKIFNKFSLAVWKPYSENPIIKPEGDGLDNKSIRGFAPMIDAKGYMVVEDSHYIGYYMGYGYGVEEARIFRTVSNGLNRVDWEDGILVLDQGVEGEWDDTTAATGNVIKLSEGNYVMNYVGKNSSNYYGIGLAFSDDGINWEKYENNPILDENDFFGQDGVTLVKPSIPYMIKLSDGRYWLAVEGVDHSNPGWGNFNIYFAMSDNLYDWETMNGGQATFSPENGSWDSSHVANPKMIEVEPGEYLMTYNGEHEEGHHRLFLGAAYSNDLVNWERYSKNPFFSGVNEFDNMRIEDPVVIKDDLDSNRIGMYFFGCNRQCHNAGSKLGAVIEYMTSDQNLLCTNSFDEDRFIQTVDNEVISSTYLSEYFSWMPSYRENGFNSKIMDESLNKVEIDFSIYFTESSFGSVGVKDNDGERYGAHLMFGGEDFQNQFMFHDGQSGHWIPTGINYDNFVWNDVRIIQKSENTFDFFFNDESALNLNNFESISEIGRLNINGGELGHRNFHIDDISVRKHLDFKPFVIFMSEQRHPSRNLNKG
jgi:hypothetical protein